MKIMTTTTAVFISIVLLTSAFAPALSASSTTDMRVAEASSSNPAMQSTISPYGGAEVSQVFSRPAAERKCKAGHIYSAHNIVGHPLACIRGAVPGVSDISSMVGGAVL
jgi:hypothetical protein